MKRESLCYSPAIWLWKRDKIRKNQFYIFQHYIYLVGGIVYYTMVSLRQPLVVQAFSGLYPNKFSNKKFGWANDSVFKSSCRTSTTNRMEPISNENNEIPCNNKGNSKRVAIVGGGLAGLSTAYHYLSKMKDRTTYVTVYDIAPVGTGGASSVAGGYVKYSIL